MPKIQIKKVEGGSFDWPAWEVECLWSAGLPVKRWGVDLSSALKKLASAISELEQREKVAALIGKEDL